MIEYIKEQSYRGPGYVVIKDGRAVARLIAMRDYTGRRGWRGKLNGKFRAETPHYNLPLSARGTLKEIKAQLANFEFPSRELEYEMACADAENDRRKFKAKELSLKLAEAARAIVAGSNYAHEQLRELSDEIERFAKDRTDYEYSLNNPSGYPYAPEPPASKKQ